MLTPRMWGFLYLQKMVSLCNQKALAGARADYQQTFIENLIIHKGYVIAGFPKCHFKAKRVCKLYANDLK
jgi:hypothetical protein